MTTELPTEAGYYLFIGDRGDHEGGPRGRVPELVCVFWYRGEVGGRLSYVGSDFFFHPEKARGVWRRVQVEDMKEAELEMQLDRFFEKAMAKLDKYSWYKRDRKNLRSLLSGNSGDIKIYESVSPLSIDEIVERAFQRGLLTDEVSQDSSKT